MDKGTTDLQQLNDGLTDAIRGAAQREMVSFCGGNVAPQEYQDLAFRLVKEGTVSVDGRLLGTKFGALQPFISGELHRGGKATMTLDWAAYRSSEFAEFLKKKADYEDQAASVLRFLESIVTVESANSVLLGMGFRDAGRSFTLGLGDRNHNVLDAFVIERRPGVFDVRVEGENDGDRSTVYAAFRASTIGDMRTVLGAIVASWKDDHSDDYGQAEASESD